MNLISYRGLPMRVIHANPIVREVVMDESKSTYLWTRWLLSYIVTYNPAALSAIPAVFQNNTSVVPGVLDPFGQNANAKPAMPPTTDAALRRFLEYPRGQLLVFGASLDNDWRHSNLILESPRRTNPYTGVAQTYDRDANNGPFCKVNSIQEIVGERMWQMHLVFETFIYEDSLGIGGVPPIIVSNRWSEATDTNWQHLATRVIDGIVHFRADLLQANSYIPPTLLVDGGGQPFNRADAFRNIFANFTVPPRFQRTQVLVKVLPSGNHVHYRVVDTEQIMQKGAPSTVRLEYDEKSWAWHGSFGRAVAQNLNAGGAPTLGEVLGAIVLPAGGLQTIMARLGTAANAVSNNLPKRFKHCTVRAWGNRDMTRASLVSTAFALLAHRMGTQSLFDLTTAECSVRYSSSQNMAEVEQTTRWNWSENGGLLNPANVINLANQLLANQDGTGRNNVGDITLTNFMAQNANDAELAQNPAQPTAQTTFPGDFGTRGTAGPRVASNPNAAGSLGFLVTQALETIGKTPDTPP